MKADINELINKGRISEAAHAICDSGAIKNGIMYMADDDDDDDWVFFCWDGGCNFCCIDKSTVEDCYKCCCVPTVVFGCVVCVCGWDRVSDWLGCCDNCCDGFCDSWCGKNICEDVCYEKCLMDTCCDDCCREKCCFGFCVPTISSCIKPCCGAD